MSAVKPEDGMDGARPNAHVEAPPLGRASQPLVVRLGGVAGLLAGALIIAAVLLPASAPASLPRVLSAVPLLLLVVWLLATMVFQGQALGRLGRAGTWSMVAGLTIIGALDLVQAVSPDAPVLHWFSSTPAGWLVSLALVAVVWGVLALGTASFATGSLPRACVVLWTVGLAASVVTDWRPATFIALAGILWSSIVLLRARHQDDSLAGPPAPPAGASWDRLVPLDALRGIIMALMAIDHASIYVRRWHPFETWDQPLPDYPSLAALLTRLATHPCAPGFFFLMGAGMLLCLEARRKAGWSDGRIIGHLALRALLFILLEQVIVDVVIAGRLTPFDFSILAGLGGAMLLGLPFLKLRGRIQALTGVVIVLLMQLLPGWLLHAELGALTPVRLLLVPGSVGPVYVLYPPVAWLGITLLGMAFARGLRLDAQRTYRIALLGGLACLALFVGLRGLGGFGNLRMPDGNGLIDFFNVVKYPPSLTFLLLSLGFDLILLGALAHLPRLVGTVGRPLATLGQAALYFFLVHWFVYAAIGMLFRTPGGLPATYLAWVVGLVLLYPICKAYEAFKHRMPAASVWRMI